MQRGRQVSFASIWESSRLNKGGYSDDPFTKTFVCPKTHSMGAGAAGVASLHRRSRFGPRIPSCGECPVRPGHDRYFDCRRRNRCPFASLFAGVAAVFFCKYRVSVVLIAGSRLLHRGGCLSVPHPGSSGRSGSIHSHGGRPCWRSSFRLWFLWQSGNPVIRPGKDPASNKRRLRWRRLYKGVL